jgi:hypothetical protein
MDLASLLWCESRTKFRFGRYQDNAAGATVIIFFKKMLKTSLNKIN